MSGGATRNRKVKINDSQLAWQWGAIDGIWKSAAIFTTKSDGFAQRSTRVYSGTSLRPQNFRPQNLIFPIDHQAGHILKDNSDISSAPQGQGVEILVVDDESAYGNFMEKLLNKNGYQATFIHKPKDALQLFKAEPDRFQLLLTDQTMPEMTCVELVGIIRKIKPELPVIVCTGYSEHFTKQDAKDMAVCYLSKPVKAETLLQEIDKLLRG